MVFVSLPPPYSCHFQISCHFIPAMLHIPAILFPPDSNIPPGSKFPPGANVLPSNDIKKVTGKKSRFLRPLTCSALSNFFLSVSAPVRVNCLHPGVVLTDLYTNVSWVKWFNFVARILFKVRNEKSNFLI